MRFYGLRVAVELFCSTYSSFSKVVHSLILFEKNVFCFTLFHQEAESDSFCSFANISAWAENEKVLSKYHKETPTLWSL